MYGSLLNKHLFLMRKQERRKKEGREKGGKEMIEEEEKVKRTAIDMWNLICYSTRPQSSHNLLECLQQSPFMLSLNSHRDCLHNTESLWLKKVLGSYLSISKDAMSFSSFF